MRAYSLGIRLVAHRPQRTLIQQNRHHQFHPIRQIAPDHLHVVCASRTGGTCLEPIIVVPTGVQVSYMELLDPTVPGTNTHTKSCLGLLRYQFRWVPGAVRAEQVSCDTMRQRVSSHTCCPVVRSLKNPSLRASTYRHRCTRAEPSLSRDCTWSGERHSA